jgi:hypothetical protein
VDGRAVTQLTPLDAPGKPQTNILSPDTSNMAPAKQGQSAFSTGTKEATCRLSASAPRQQEWPSADPAETHTASGSQRTVQQPNSGLLLALATSRFSTQPGGTGVAARRIAPLIQAQGQSGPDLAALDRRVRACARLTQAAAEHKTRIKDLVRQLMPVTPLTGDIGQADLAVLERYGDPRALLAAGLAELTQMITVASHHQQGCDRARQWHHAAAAAIELYQDHPAVPFAELAAEVATEIRLLRITQAELAAHAAAREQHYLQAGPAQLARSLPGFAEISGPVLAAAMGRPGRFRDGTKFSPMWVWHPRPAKPARPTAKASR